MMTNDVNVFQKMKRKTCIGKAYKVDLPWHERCGVAMCRLAL